MGRAERPISSTNPGGAGADWTVYDPNLDPTDYGDGGGLPPIPDEDTTPSPVPLRRTTRIQSELEWNQSAAGQRIPIIFGRARIGAQFIYVKATQSVLYLASGICFGPVNSITPRIGGTAMTYNIGRWVGAGGMITVDAYDGTQKTVDETLSSFDSTWDQTFGPVGGSPDQDKGAWSAGAIYVVDDVVTDRGIAYYCVVPHTSPHQPPNENYWKPRKTGLAYAGLELTFDTHLLTGVPQFTFDVEGLKTYDPRSQTIVFHENPALAIREVLVNQTWGRRLPPSMIDDASFVAAADACDFEVDDGIKRYRIGLAISQQASVDDWLRTLKTHCMGNLQVIGGKWTLTIDQPWSGPKKIYSDVDYSLAGEVRPANVVATSVKVSRRERMSMYNQLHGTCTQQYDTVTDPGNPRAVFVNVDATVATAGVLSGSEDPRTTDYQFAGCPTKDQLIRTLTTILNRSYDDLVVEWTSPREAIASVPGDVITFTGGGLAQDLRIRSIASSGPDFDITADEYHEASYNDTVNNEDSVVQTILPDPHADPDPPVFLPSDLVIQYPVSADGRQTVAALVSFVPAVTPFYRATRMWIRYGTEPEMQYGDFAAGPVLISNPQLGVLLRVTLKTLTTFGRLSTEVHQEKLVSNPTVLDIDNVNAPTWDATVRGLVWWTDPVGIAIDHFEIYDTYLGGSQFAKTVPAAASPTEASPLDLRAWLHGDGYIESQTLDVTVKVVTVGGDRSPGYRIYWTIPASGEALYDLDFGGDPRDACFDVTHDVTDPSHPIIRDQHVWVTQFAADSIIRINRFDISEDVPAGHEQKTLSLLSGATDRGAWSSGTNYAIGDMATSGGVRYHSIATPNQNHQPPNGTYWVVSSSKPYGCTVDADGDVWVVSSGIGGSNAKNIWRIKAYDDTTHALLTTPVIRQTISNDSQLAGARAIVDHSSSQYGPSLWVSTATKLCRVVRPLNFGTPTVSHHLTPGVTQLGFMVILDDMLYATSFDGNCLWKIDLTVEPASLSTEQAFSRFDIPPYFVFDSHRARREKHHAGPWGICVGPMPTSASSSYGVAPLGSTTAFEGSSGLWIACYASGTVACINPAKGARNPVLSVELGARSGPVDCAYDGSSIWVTEGASRHLTRIDPLNGAILSRVPLDSFPRTVLYDGTDLWTPMNTNGIDGSITITVENPDGTESLTSAMLTITGTNISPLP